MTMEQLNSAVREAEAKVAELQLEENALDAEWREYQEKRIATYRAWCEKRKEVNAAQYAAYDAKLAVSQARNNAIIAEHDGMSREGFMAGLRAAVRSKANPGIVEQLVRRIEVCADNVGVMLDEMYTWTAKNGYTRELSDPQKERVGIVLNRACPKTPEGGYLPPYTV